MIIKSLKDDRNKIATYLGGEYSFITTLVKGGTGSVRIIYVKGVKEFDEVTSLDLSLNFCNLQVYKTGFAVRLIKKGIGQILGMNFSELNKIEFITTPIRVRLRRRIVIRHKADVIVNSPAGKIFFEVPQVYYKSFKRYLAAHFTADIIDWKSKAIEDDEGGNVLNVISRLVS